MQLEDKIHCPKPFIKTNKLNDSTLSSFPSIKKSSLVSYSELTCNQKKKSIECGRLVSD